ncbi:MAG TPA: hypothetical protein ENI23_00250 [bacterium]|nr:hypothetical protein [bacterium]
MASIWTLDGGDFYVDTDKEGVNPHVVEHNPINSSNSFWHKVYTPDDEVTLAGHVVGKTHMNTLRDAAGNVVVLITDENGIAPSGINVFFKKFDYDRLNTTCQTVDRTQPETAPLYAVTVLLRR